MSLSSALNSAMSGLTAAGRASGVVSDNIANVMTPGYSRRTLEVTSSADTGPGVKIVGVHRHSDPVLVSERRSADSQYANAKLLADFHARFESLVGSPTDSQSIGARLAEFESSLITAASNPDSTQRLDGVAHSATALSDAINTAASGLAQLRSQADTSIGLQVERLNQALQNVQKLNLRITAAQSSGGDTASLLDQRQAIVDQINEIVPINQADRDYGQIALYTDGGAILLDGKPATITFSTANGVTPDMTIGNGGLSGLQVNGIPASARAIAGGTLAANFEIRDSLAVSAQSDLDAVARDLIERFETASLDSTVAPGSPGLFTDDGAAFDPLLEVGLAGRISLNTAVDPAAGGESWRIRAGLGAASPGMPGEARLLQAFSNILSETRVPASSVFGTGETSAAGLSSRLMSRAAQHSHFADQALSFATASKTELTQMELAQGVDTDAELQNLMIIEQAYAANARMIEAVDEMMNTLLRL